MNIKETLEVGQINFNSTIKLMDFFLSIGMITNENKDLKTIVNYKQKIVFSTLDSLTYGSFKPPNNWTSLNIIQKDEWLDNIIYSILSKNNI